MKIIGLKAENIKTIKLVEIKPDGNIVKLSGKNGAGKSTVMDSIAYALGGKRLIPDVPIKDGKDKAEIVVKLDDLTVVRKFKRDKTGSGYTTTLKVTAKDGAAYGKAQDVLDKITGKLSFDPFAFSTMTEKEQGDLLKGMVDIGIDADEWQTKYDSLFQTRRDANRDLKTAESKIDGLPSYDNTPTDELSASEIATEYEAALNADSKEQDRLSGIESWEEDVSTWKRVVTEKEEALEIAKEKLQGALDGLEESKAKPIIVVPDLAGIKARMDSMEETNSRVRDNQAFIEAGETLKAAREKADGLDAKLKAHEKVKADAIKNADYPVEGLEFSDTGLLYNGTPLAEASSGQKIKISALIGMMLNPELRVLFIRNASLIDSANFKILSDIATAKDYQMWTEFMDETGDVGIFLEDGEIKGEKS